MTDKPFGVDLLLPSNFMGVRPAERCPRPRELIPAATRAGVRKMAEDLGVEWHELRHQMSRLLRVARRGMSMGR